MTFPVQFEIIGARIFFEAYKLPLLYRLVQYGEPLKIDSC